MNKLIQSNAPTYTSIEEASHDVLEVISKFVGVNTFFIAKNDKTDVNIISSFNRENLILESGFETLYRDSYWQFIVQGGREPLIIDNLATHASTKDMEVTKSLGGGSLIGAPIYYRNGDNYGTLCGLDTKPFHYTQDHVDLFKAMANLLGNVLKLERANSEIESLSVPIVPISNEVAILPIIGDVSELRTEQLMEKALAESAKHQFDYLIFDLSGLANIRSESASLFLI